MLYTELIAKIVRRLMSVRWKDI